MDNNNLINIIKTGYNQIWKLKIHGNTLEIITPMLTTNNLFVSIFITERDNSYIITDGGWIDSNFYDNESEETDDCYKHCFLYYKEQFGIKEKIYNGKIYYFKKANSKELVINALLEVSTFISYVVSTSFVQFNDKKEKGETKRFNTEANDYIISLLPGIKIRKNDCIDSNHSQIKFGTIIPLGKQISLVNHVTGTNDYYFRSSISRSITSFQLLDRSTFRKEIIKNRITIINDKADGYNESKIAPYIALTQDGIESKIVFWSKKDKIKELVF